MLCTCCLRASKRWGVQVVIEQLLVGVLLLAPLVALLPTTLAFYALVLLISRASTLLRQLLLMCARLVDVSPVLALALWLVQPVCGATWLPGSTSVYVIDATQPSAADCHAIWVRDGPNDGRVAQHSEKELKLTHMRVRCNYITLHQVLVAAARHLWVQARRATHCSAC